MPLLVLLIGIPGSGKSCLAAQLQQAGGWLISTDCIREQLFGNAAIQGEWRLIWREVERQMRAAAQQIQMQAEKSHPSGSAKFAIDFAIYDATNAKRRSRREAIALAKTVGFTRIIAIWLDPPLELCLQRNRQRQRQVPEAIIQRMYRQIWSAPPRLREGLDLLLHCERTPGTLELMRWGVGGMRCEVGGMR